MGVRSRGRAAVKFGFWTVTSIGLFILAAWFHKSGKFSEWYYYTASEDGYAVNADTFTEATPEKPALLAIGPFQTVEGLQAVPVKAGERLPARANGVITLDILKAGERAILVGDRLQVMVPWKIAQAKGFKYKDTFKHKGIHTYSWAAVYNVLLVIALGISLGYLAEGFTDLIGLKVEKIRHFEGH